MIFSVVLLCQQRRMNLYRARDLYRFIQDDEEEISWLQEKEDLCISLLRNRDLSATLQLRRIFKVIFFNTFNSNINFFVTFFIFFTFN